jgi:hypothetical protein
MVSNVQTQLTATLPFSGRPTIDITHAATTLTFNGDFVYQFDQHSRHVAGHRKRNGIINGDFRTSSARLEKSGTGRGRSTAETT